MSKNEPFAPWQCPLCGEKLTGDSTLKCTKGHCFDRAKEGSWHLLPVQSMRTKAPGDSKEMVIVPISREQKRPCAMAPRASIP